MEEKRSLGIWIYGIIFLICSLFCLAWAMYSFLGCILRPGEFHYGGSFLLLFSIILMVPTLIFMLLGIFTLMRKFHFALIIILIICTLLAIFLTVWFAADWRHFSDNLLNYSFIWFPFLLLFTSAIFYLTRPKVRSEFR